MAAGNKNLNSAKTARKDEFYTQLTDIEKEMRYYRKHFKDKTVLCNCDDPFESNFFKYFVLNFNRLGLKKLIATCYTGSPIANKQLSIFDILGESEETQNKPYKAVVTTVYDKTGDGGVDMLDVAELFKYYLIEMQAPAGYILLDRPVIVTVESTRVYATLGSDPTAANIAEWDASGAYWKITVHNNPGVSLPNTGGPGTNFIYFPGTILTALAGAGLVMRRKRKAA